MHRAALLALVVAALVGGLRWPALAMVALAALGGVAGGPRPPAETPEPVTRGERLALAAVVAAFLATTLPLLDPDRPLGTDWMAYLKNALAIATDDPALYQKWRGPVHAWASLAATPLVGGLVEGSQLVSVVSATALIPLTWLLGRSLFGASVALVAAALVAGWADLRVYAVASTPYPFVAALTTAGGAALALGAGAATPGAFAAAHAAAAILLGLAYGADLRGGAAAVLMVVGAALLPGLTRVRAVALALVGVSALGLGGAAIASAPVTLIPLHAQILLQRDLNAREGVGPGEVRVCPARGPAWPRPDDLYGPCGRATLARNLSAANEAIPIGAAAAALLVALGLLWAPKGRALLGLPLLPALPAMLIIGVQHRYVVPIAPSLALLVAVALTRLAGGSRFAPGLRVALVALLAAAWQLWPGGFWAGAVRGSGVDPAFSLTHPPTYPSARRALRAANDADRVVDCTHADFRVRLYPHPVERIAGGPPDRPSRRCSQLLTAGAPAGTWLLVELAAHVPQSPRWDTVVRAPIAGTAELRVLRGTSRAPR